MHYQTQHFPRLKSNKRERSLTNHRRLNFEILELRLLLHAGHDEMHHPFSDPLGAEDPIVVDFGGAIPGAPIAGLDQFYDSGVGAGDVLGVKQIMVLRVYFKDRTNVSRYSRVQVENLTSEIDRLFQDTSYGNMSIDFQVSSLFQLPRNRSEYIDVRPDGDLPDGSNFDKVLKDAISNAPTTDGLDWSNLDAIIVLLAETDSAKYIRGQGTSRRFLPQGPTGISRTVGAAIVSENPSETDRENVGVWAHEVGHIFQQGGPAHPSNYNSEFELLDNNLPGQIGVFEKQGDVAFPGWLPVTKYQEFRQASGGGIANIYAMEYNPATRPNIQAVKAIITDSLYYLISVRRRVLGDDLNPDFSPNGIPDEGVLIERVEEGADQWVTVQGNRGDRNALWKNGDRYENPHDGIAIEILQQIDGDNYQIRVTFDPDTTTVPDVFMEPWRSPPGNAWETTDIWVDSPVNGYGRYRYGTWNDLRGNLVPRGNGDDPNIGQVNRVYARVRNIGSFPATDVNVHFEITDPPGVGITGTTGWTALGSVDKTLFPGLASIAPGGFVDVFIPWTPDVPIADAVLEEGRFAFHSCLRVQVDPVFRETVFGNQDGKDEQENIRYFMAVPDPSVPGGGSRLEDFITLVNDDLTNPRFFYLSYESDLPTAWSLDINGGELGIEVGPGELAEIPITIEPRGLAVLGSIFSVDVQASTQRILVNDLDPTDTHLAFDTVGGMRIESRVVRDTNLDCTANVLGPNEVMVTGQLHVEDFQEFFNPNDPFQVMIIGRDEDARYLPATSRLLTVQPDGTFAGFLGVDLAHPHPSDVVVLFAGTALLASSGCVQPLTQGLVGDYNGNGSVDAADYVVWRKTGINGLQGYNDWRTFFGSLSAFAADTATSSIHAPVDMPSAISGTESARSASDSKRPIVDQNLAILARPSAVLTKQLSAVAVRETTWSAINAEEMLVLLAIDQAHAELSDVATTDSPLVEIEEFATNENATIGLNGTLKVALEAWGKPVTYLRN
jgi:hypothetical protein